MKRSVLNKYNFLKYILALIFINASIFITKAQRAKDKQSFPLGIMIGAHSVDWSNTNENSAIQLEYQDRISSTFGLKYQFYNYKNLEFYTGFKVRLSSSSLYYKIDSEDLGVNLNFNRYVIFSPYWTYHLPLEVEYPIYQRDKFRIQAKLGYELQYYGITTGSDTRVALSVDNIPRLVAENREHQSFITSGINIGLGFDFYTEKYARYRIDLIYHNHFQTLEKEKITTQNLNISPNTTSTHRWTGNYLGLELSYFPRPRQIDQVKKEKIKKQHGEIKKGAEYLFEDVFPLGIGLTAYDHYFTNSDSFGYAYSRQQKNSFGISLNYNYLQTGKFNFGVGIGYKNISTTANLFIPAANASESEDVNLGFDRDFDIFNLTLKAEFVKALSKKHFLSASLALEANSIQDDDLNGQSFVYRNNAGDDLVAIQFKETSSINILTPVSLGYYYKSSNAGLFNVNLTYSPSDYLVQEERLINLGLNTGQGTSSVHSWNGSYLALTLNWYPNRKKK
ncbi:hypothetical protein BST92_07475 [Nonlabens arenilitoris]|uniref:Uncharacterized protein n=1 Tax=Nonlabens arenilitoris TaxID=1217969 RepID=A0A2S7UBI2_9FLAO|nr:hypothetical protein [Nonlabens arenilitoris]PQJ31774.1 hypothetical protein BST92_07475 [Nonlabens arenilitoris]